MADIITQVLAHLKDIFEHAGEGEIHGYIHAHRVYIHACNAIDEVLDLWALSHEQTMAIKLAALLHDVDDEKVFPSNHGELVNANHILDSIKFEAKADVLEMIRLVGFSQNGIREFYRSDDPFIFKDGMVKRRGTLHQIEKWKLIPRDCDRVEALGKIGVARCIGFGCLIRRPLFDSSKTPRLDDDWSIRKKAVKYWLGNDEVPHTTVDYFIKGLVLRTIMSSGVKYLENIAFEGQQPILEIIKTYGRHGYLNRSMVLDVVEGDDDAIRIVNDIKEMIFVP